ncbi:MAG: cbb3-type cytochrome c oxidase subunit I [bacterium]|nr:cbb3-type cytochrome c oxidase subunit I [bacterium]
MRFRKMAQDAARAYWRFTILWLIIGAVLGILASLSLLVPGFHTSHPLPGYGRLVSAHRACMIHGVLMTAVMAQAYTLLPRLTKSRVKSVRFSLIAAWIGFAIVAVGIIQIIAGMGSGREYSDLPTGFAILFWFYLIAVAIDLSLLLAGSNVMASNPSSLNRNSRQANSLSESR